MAVIAAAFTALLGIIAAFDLNRVAPARSTALRAAYMQTNAQSKGAALFAFGDFGAIDLDTLETSAMPWPILTAVIAMVEAQGDADKANWAGVVQAFKRFGFLYPDTFDGVPGLQPSQRVPLGLSLGHIERIWPPLRIAAVNIGCAACHAGPAYAADGTPIPSRAVPGRPNTALNLENFSQSVYRAMRAGLADETQLFRAMRRLFPEMTVRERLSLSFAVLPRARQRLKDVAAGIDKPLPFHNGAPGLTNGVGALKSQLGVMQRDRYDSSAGFVSVPDLADRVFRSALLADGAYAPKGETRFRLIGRVEAEARDNHRLAEVASFFMVPSMGLAPARTEAAIPELVLVLDSLRVLRPPRFPGVIDDAKATRGRAVFARHCASCHGTYDESLTAPRLLAFPNWAGDVGADPSRRDAFTDRLKAAIDATGHGRRLIDVAVTRKIAAPLLSGLWSSAPYLTNGSIPTLRHLLLPRSRPARFMTGGHQLSMSDVGIAGEMRDGVWAYRVGYKPYATPVVIDTGAPGFSNRGHEREVEGLDAGKRDDLIEYLKLL